ncbi:MAG TPA: nickel ABC transporter permease [Candidatus Limnocylindrales bacterium]|nr:nickel ABC transporter permease [Candidatus Limnocylindrales bacterium]
MIPYIIRRLLWVIPVILGVSTLVFFFIHLIPGDPVELMLGESAEPADKAALREELGLNKPILQQYTQFLWRLAQGNLGRSLHTHKPVLQSILTRYPATLELTFAALGIAVIIAIPVGVMAATRQYSWLDNGSMFLALLGVSMPNFWLGPLFIILFSINLGWLPVSGRGGWDHLILPAITLGMAMAAILTRMTRSSVLEVIHEDYIRTARAKGLRESVVIFKHALRNALIPVITLIGLQFGTLLSGAVITETIFAWPGIGRLTIEAINKRDYPLVQGCILVIALSYVLVNLITDLIYSLVDPRIRYEK